MDGPLPPRIEIEPASSVVGLTQWTPDDDAVVIDAASYYSVTRDSLLGPSSSLFRAGPNQNEPSVHSRSPTWRAGR